MRGYIVKSGSKHLTKDYSWHEHTRDEDAYVFDAQTVIDIFVMSEHWDVKPETATPAICNEGETIVGYPIPFEEV